MVRLDLHTHSIVSYDGGISAKQYAGLLERRIVDYIAVTDHNRLDQALELRNLFGDRVIVGEEIATMDGDIIGLFLDKPIDPGLPLAETIKVIKDQGGLVYVPHPFERDRRGLQQTELESLHNEFDIIEVFNARGWGRQHAPAARQFATKYGKAIASASDAHGLRGVGSSYVELSEPPSRSALIDQLRAGTRVCRYAPASSYLDPTINRLKKYFSIKYAS
jgi:predicted metal-dependent phosphoesterase TrpH